MKTPPLLRRRKDIQKNKEKKSISFPLGMTNCSLPIFIFIDRNHQQKGLRRSLPRWIDCWMSFREKSCLSLSPFDAADCSFPVSCESSFDDGKVSPGAALCAACCFCIACKECSLLNNALLNNNSSVKLDKNLISQIGSVTQCGIKHTELVCFKLSRALLFFSFLLFVFQIYIHPKHNSNPD